MYLAGAVSGSLIFGYLTNRWGRKRLYRISRGSTMGAGNELK
jgi:MFS family permease